INGNETKCSPPSVSRMGLPSVSWRSFRHHNAEFLLSSRTRCSFHDAVDRPATRAFQSGSAPIDVPGTRDVPSNGARRTEGSSAGASPALLGDHGEASRCSDPGPPCARRELAAHSHVFLLDEHSPVVARAVLVQVAMDLVWSVKPS